MTTPDRSSARLLLTGPAGSGKTQRALGRIREAATAPGPRGRGAAAPGDALLVLPTYAQVMHVKRLALSRWDVRGLLDQPFTTFTAAGERFLPSFRVRTLPSPEERDRLMKEALQQREPDVFRDVIERAGFRAHLLRLVKDLKQTGLEGGEAREHLAAAREHVTHASRAKLDAFLAVFECYEDLLERAGLEDHEDALRRLARRLENEPPARPPSVLVVDGFDDFSRIEERILDALADAVTGAGGEALITLPWDGTRPHVFAGSRGARDHLLRTGFVEESLVGFPRSGFPRTGFPRSTAAPLARIAERLFAPEGEPLPGGASVQMYVAGDAEDEAETVARAVRHLVTRSDGEEARGEEARGGTAGGARSWRDVGVVVRRLDEHAPRLESAFARLGVPLRVVGRGEALASEPLVRALRGPLDVLSDQVEPGRFRAGPVMEWLRWRALCVGDLDVAALDAWDIELRTHGFPTDFAALRAAAPEALAAPLEQLAQLASSLAAARGPEAVYGGLQTAVDVLAPLPEASGFDDDGRPVDVAHDRRLARAVSGRARVLDILRALRVAVERTDLGGAAHIAEAAVELHDALEQTTLRLPDRRLDAVTLMDAEEARFWDLPIVVVASLEEGGFPVRPREDVLLRDRDREALRSADPALRLPMAREREARERRLFYGAVTRASSRLVLVRRAYDDKGDPKERSSYLRELERVVTPTVAAEVRSPGRVARPATECFTRSDWLLHAAARTGPWATRRQDVSESDRIRAVALQAVAGTSAPERAVRQRRRGTDPLWENDAEREAVLAAFAAQTEQVSVSRLNHAVLCPHRFFLAYVAGVPQDDLTIDGPAFDVRDMGKAIHHAFELAIRHPEREPADLARAGVEHVNASGIEALILESELTRTVALLRDRERKTRGPLAPTAAALEFSFGYDEPVELGPDDCRFRIGGYVDRIDRGVLDDGTPGGGVPVASIVDYKRSATSAESSFGKAKDGRDLQVPLYARALERLLGVRVVGFEWMAGLTRQREILHDADAAALFDGRREAKKPLAEAHEDFRARMDDAEATAIHVVRQARAGAHDRAPVAAKTCLGDKGRDVCPWLTVCKPDVAFLERQEEDDA